jgi:Caspase domain
MKKLLSTVAAAAAFAFVAIGGSVDAWADRRVALVVGNSNYKSPGISLPNPRNDAEDVSAVLKTLGFEVKTTVDASKRDMDLALADFARRATDADSALFFYAGHAMQFQGRNYLMPTDAELEDEISVRYQMVGLQDVTAALDRANGVKIMILDACRNNPLANRLQGALRGLSSPTRGLARVDKTQGMVVAYATAADEVAQDGQGRNSPFTAALLKRIQEPGLEIEMMFRRVAADVNAQTGGRQRPETTISLLSEFYLNQNDRIVFERMNKDDRTALRDFINKYPSSPLVNNALHQLDILERIAREREEERRKAEEAEARLKALAEAEAKRKAEEAEARRKAEEAQAKRKADEAEAKRKADEIAEAKRKADEAAEAKRKADEIAEAKRKADEIAEAKRKADEIAEAKRKADEVAEAKRKADERLANLEQKPGVPPASVPAPVTTSPGPVTAPPAAKANRPEQIREAQTELRRLGCFDGKPDGQLNDATRNAVEAWSKHTTHKPVEINITDDFIEELKRQHREICVPERRQAPPVASHPPSSRGKNTAAASPAPLRPAGAPPAAPAPKPEPPRVISSGHNTGVGF